jgi:hypothetical protein
VELREAVREWLAALEAGEILETRQPPRIGHKLFK